MGSIYKGFGGNKLQVGYCEEGVIYSGRTPVGSYENGSIYNQFKEYVGSYSGGSIYNQFNEHVGSYEDGIVYNKYLNAVFGKEQIGSYDGDPAGAAALILLFVGEKTANGTNDKEGESNSSTNSSYGTSGSNSSDTGCLSVLFTILCGILSLIFVYVISPFFVYIWIPTVLSLTWIGLAGAFLTALIGSSGLVPPLYAFYIYASILSIIEILFYMYWVLVIVVKIKTRSTRKDMLKLFGKWFLKGPFAFVDVVNIMTENNIMPRITKLFNRAFDFISRK